MIMVLSGCSNNDLIIIDDSFNGTHNDTVFVNGDVNVTGNINVTGCLIYNGGVLGVCV